MALFQTAETGIYHDIRNLEEPGRLKSYSASDVTMQLDSFVRKGEHVLITVEVVGKMMMAQDFSSKGKSQLSGKWKYVYEVERTNIYCLSNPLCSFSFKIMEMTLKNFLDNFTYIYHEKRQSTHGSSIFVMRNSNKKFSLSHSRACEYELAQSHNHNDIDIGRCDMAITAIAINTSRLVYFFDINRYMLT